MTLPRVIIDVGFAGPTVGMVFTVGDPVRGVIGANAIGGDVWVNVSQFVRSWSVRWGASRTDDPTLRYDPATATIVLHDPDRRFDPDNLDGPYVSAGRSEVEPMRRVRIRAVWAGVTYPIFYGFSDDFQADYQGNDWTYVTLTATDGFKVFAANDRSAAVSQGADEDAGARMERILDAAGWPAEDRRIATGDTALQATDLSGSQLAEMQLVQDTEMGEMYIDRRGRLVFRNRHALLEDDRSRVPQATFGDGGIDAGEIPYADVAPSSIDEGMVNWVSITREGGVEQIAEDVAARQRYLTKTFRASGLLMRTDAEALQYAKAIRYRYARPARRFARIEFNTPQPHVAAQVWPALLGRELGDRITIRRRPYGGGAPIEREEFVRGGEHSSDGEKWQSAFVLQSAERYSFFVIGDPVLGVVGSNAIAY